MKGHSCPFTLGQLLAAAAICSTSTAAGGPKLAQLLRDHARQHQPEQHQEADR